MSRTTLVQIEVLSAIVLSNYVAQVFYFFRLYYSPEHPLPALRSTLLLGGVLILFLAGLGLTLARRRAGYPLLVFYLALQFFFYLYNLVEGALHGLGWFFHLSEPDPVLWAVFAVGYLSFIASGLFLALALARRRELAV